MFFHRRKPAPFFDKEGKIPAIRSSICTGEQVAGFRDKQTGRFTEMMLIRDDADFEKFLQEYAVAAEEVERIW